MSWGKWISIPKRFSIMNCSARRGQVKYSKRIGVYVLVDDYRITSKSSDDIRTIFQNMETYLVNGNCMFSKRKLYILT